MHLLHHCTQIIICDRGHDGDVASLDNCMRVRYFPAHQQYAPLIISKALQELLLEDRTLRLKAREESEVGVVLCSVV